MAQYLDQAGLQTLVTNIKAEDTKVKQLVYGTAEGASLNDLTTTAKGSVVAAVNELVTKDGEKVVTVEKLATAETGYAASYVVKQNGTAVGDKINIPKDWVLKNVELKTCETADQPEAGYKVGDKYFDFSFNTKDASETVTHVYLKVNELVDVYTSGSAVTDKVVVAIDASTNKVTASVTAGTIEKTDLKSELATEITSATAAIGTKKVPATETEPEVPATGIYKEIDDLKESAASITKIEDSVINGLFA